MTRVTRRAALGAFGAAAVGAPAVLRGRYRVFAGAPQEYSARAVGLLRHTVVVDLLNQFRFADYAERPPKSERWLRAPGSFTPADAAVYHGSGINVFALGDGAKDFEQGVRFFADWNGFIAAYPDDLLRVDKAGDFEKARATGKVGILLSFQDSTHFRGPDDVDAFFGMGQRLSQLTYNFDNRIGSGFLEQRDGGLTVFGLSILARMERVGMAVDVSHCGDQTTLDALDGAKRPVVITHANCRALVPGHLRCKTDEMIRKMAKTGGVMGVGFLRFLNRDSEPVTIDDVPRPLRSRRAPGRRAARRRRVGPRHRRQRQPGGRRRLPAVVAAELRALPIPRRPRRAHLGEGARSPAADVRSGRGAHPARLQ